MGRAARFRGPRGSRKEFLEKKDSQVFLENGGTFCGVLLYFGQLAAGILEWAGKHAFLAGA